MNYYDMTSSKSCTYHDNSAVPNYEMTGSSKSTLDQKEIFPRCEPGAHIPFMKLVLTPLNGTVAIK